MSRWGPARISLAPVRHVWTSPRRDSALLLSEVREHAQRGCRVHVTRAGGGTFEVVKNGELFMVRTLYGDAVGTWDNVAAALMGGDRHLDSGPEDDFGEHPGGAA